MRILLSILWSFIAVLAMPVHAQSGAAKAGPLVTLSLKKVETDGRSERLVSASRIAPGDVVEYQAVTRNASDSVAHDVFVTIPVPPGGLELLPQWQGARAVSGSVQKSP